MIKKIKLVFDNLKDSPLANLISAGIMFVALLIAFVFARSIKSIMPDIGYFSTQMLFVFYCVVIAFGVLIVVFDYIYLFKKLEKRLYLYRMIGATKLDIFLIQFAEVFVKYNLVFVGAIIVSEYLISLAEGVYFPSLNMTENIIIYFVMLVVILLSVMLTLFKLLFGKNTIINKEFL